MGARDRVVAEGMKWIGKLHYSQIIRYDFRDGGSADCSSFYQHCLKTGAGVNPGNWTGEQITKGRPISRDELLPGDAVFYPGHVVLYVGNNKCLSQGGPRFNDMGPVIKTIDYRGDITQYRRYIEKDEGGFSSNDHPFSVPIIKHGSKGVAVLLLQEILIARGYNTGGLDRSYGDLTVNAVKSYQTTRGLSPDGICGVKTWDDLLALEKSGGSYIARNCFQGHENASVLLVQEILKARTYYKGNLDWIFGTQTQNAVRAYQSDRKGSAGPVDGAVGAKTWNDLLGM